MRRQIAEEAPDSKRKRSKKSRLIIADSDDEESDAAIKDEESGEGTRFHENNTGNGHNSCLCSADVVSTL